jgi:hypothetical protein
MNPMSSKLKKIKLETTAGLIKIEDTKISNFKEQD